MLVSIWSTASAAISSVPRKNFQAWNYISIMDDGKKNISITLDP